MNEPGPNWWKRNREWVLTFFGLTLIGFEAVNAELRGGSFHYEFLGCGLLLCGIAVAWLGDKRG